RHDQEQIGCDHRADEWPCLGNGLPERRSLRREQLYCSGRCGISKRVRALWLRQRIADWNFVLWPGLERADPHQDCICLRASHAVPAATEVSTHPRSSVLELTGW